VCAFNTDAHPCLPHYQACHTDVVHSVDFSSSVIVSGSRDATVKVSLGHCASAKGCCCLLSLIAMEASLSCGYCCLCYCRYWLT